MSKWTPSLQAIEEAILTYENVSTLGVLYSQPRYREWMRRALRAAYRVDHPTRRAGREEGRG